jgi:hypothetical protein
MTRWIFFEGIKKNTSRCSLERRICLPPPTGRLPIFDWGETWLRKEDEEIFRGSKQTFSARQQKNNLRTDVRGTCRRLLM